MLNFNVRIINSGLGLISTPVSVWFHWVFPTKDLNTFLLSLIHAIRPAYLIFLDLLMKLTMCYYRQSPPTSYLSHNISLNFLVSNTPSLCPCLKVTNFHIHIIEQAKL